MEKDEVIKEFDSFICNQLVKHPVLQAKQAFTFNSWRITENNNIYSYVYINHRRNGIKYSIQHSFAFSEENIERMKVVIPSVLFDKLFLLKKNYRSIAIDRSNIPEKYREVKQQIIDDEFIIGGKGAELSIYFVSSGMYMIREHNPEKTLNIMNFDELFQYLTQWK